MALPTRKTLKYFAKNEMPSEAQTTYQQNTLKSLERGSDLQRS